MNKAESTKVSKKILIGCGILLGLSLLFLFLASMLLLGEVSSFNLSSAGKDKIAVVEVFGPIVTASKTVKQIKKFAKDKSIKGILLHIDSPGGGVAPSQEIYQALLEAKKKKPVVASMASLGASGGYYIALGTDKIVANPGTITGSIGVIIGFMNMRSLFSKVGLEPIVVKSGKFKDIGNPNREFTKEDRAVIQSVIDDVYGQFVEAVSQNRNIKLKEVLKLADGRIYSGRQAYDRKLVDELGTFSDAVKILAKMAGIKGEPQIVRDEEKYLFLKELLSEKLSIIDRIDSAIAIRPGVNYLWLP